MQALCYHNSCHGMGGKLLQCLGCIPVLDYSKDCIMHIRGWRKSCFLGHRSLLSNLGCRAFHFIQNSFYPFCAWGNVEFEDPFLLLHFFHFLSDIVFLDYWWKDIGWIFFSSLMIFLIFSLFELFWRHHTSESQLSEGALKKIMSEAWYRGIVFQILVVKGRNIISSYLPMCIWQL